MAQDGSSGEPPRVAAVRVVTESGQVLEENPSQLTLKLGQPYSGRPRAPACESYSVQADMPTCAPS